MARDKKEVLNKKGKVVNGECRAYLLFSALGDANRLRIYRILNQYDEICVTDLAKIIGISVPAVSQHLKILENAGLVIRERYGQTVCYQINKKDVPYQQLMQIIKQAEDDKNTTENK